MDAGDFGETAGVALAAIGVLIGKVYRERAERSFTRIVLIGLAVSIVAMILLGAAWTAVGSVA